MKNSLIILLVASGLAYAAQVGTLSRSSDVALTADLESYAVDPTSLQTQIDNIDALFDSAITTNLSNLVISNGVIVGTF